MTTLQVIIYSDIINHHNEITSIQYLITCTPLVIEKPDVTGYFPFTSPVTPNTTITIPTMKDKIPVIINAMAIIFIFLNTSLLNSIASAKK